MKQIEKRCLACGVAFTVEAKHGGSPGCCSDECKAARLRERKRAAQARRYARDPARQVAYNRAYKARKKARQAT